MVRAAAISRQASRDLSVTCLVSGLDWACCVSVWLNFARWTLVTAARRGRLQERFAIVFMGVGAGAPETHLPTLKTGNGESRSWVRIPPHPLFGMASFQRRSSYSAFGNRALFPRVHVSLS
jgi:hypothetical protein